MRRILRNKIVHFQKFKNKKPAHAKRERVKRMIAHPLKNPWRRPVRQAQGRLYFPVC